MPFQDELNLSTSIQPSESLSEPIPSSSDLSEMSQINPTPSKQPKISESQILLKYYCIKELRAKFKQLFFAMYIFLDSY
jgi:hypothetical protein